MQTHVPEHLRLFKCDVCSRGFVTEYRLKHHVRSVHCDERDKKFACNQCEYKWVYLLYFIVHYSRSKKSQSYVFFPDASVNQFSVLTFEERTKEHILRCVTYVERCAKPNKDYKYIDQKSTQMLPSPECNVMFVDHGNCAGMFKYFTFFVNFN